MRVHVERDVYAQRIYKHMNTSQLIATQAGFTWAMAGFDQYFKQFDLKQGVHNKAVVLGAKAMELQNGS